jgi:hypothetical protein
MSGLWRLAVGPESLAVTPGAELLESSSDYQGREVWYYDAASTDGSMVNQVGSCAGLQTHVRVRSAPVIWFVPSPFFTDPSSYLRPSPPPTHPPLPTPPITPQVEAAQQQFFQQRHEQRQAGDALLRLQLAAAARPPPAPADAAAPRPRQQEGTDAGEAGPPSSADVDSSLRRGVSYFESMQVCSCALTSFAILLSVTLLSSVCV